MWAQAVRVIANLSGETTDAIESRLDHWIGWLTGVGLPIRWSNGALHDGNLMEIMEAEREYWGRFPAMFVVDVAFDLMRGEEGAGNANRVFRSLHHCAAKTGAVVVAIHHVKGGDAANGDQYVAMTDSVFRVERVPEIILTMWRGTPGTVHLHLAKNRTGVDGMTIPLHIDFSRAKVVA
jgi:hypothetical protein